MNILLNKANSRIKLLGRRGIRFFGGLEYRDAEYNFVGRQVFGDGVSVLDVGAHKSLLPLQFAKRGYSVTVYDLQKYHETHPKLSIIHGNFLSNDLPDHSFDYVVMLSSIEHMGRGTYGAPVYADGDFKAMSEAKRVLKRSGKIVITFPFIGTQQIGNRFDGYYNLARVQNLFEGLYVLAEEYYLPNRTIFSVKVNLLPATMEQITKVDHSARLTLYSCIACYVVSPSPRPNFH